MLCSLVFAAPQNGQHPPDHVRVADRPLVGLPGAHRPAGDELQRLDPELLGDQPVLQLDLVVERDVRETCPVVRRRRVARRAREPVAEHVRDDDEVLGGVERHALADQPLVVVVPARVPRRIDDRVALVGVERRRRSCRRASRRGACRRAGAARRPGRRPRSWAFHPPCFSCPRAALRKFPQMKIFHAVAVSSDAHGCWPSERQFFVPRRRVRAACLADPTSSVRSAVPGQSAAETIVSPWRVISLQARRWTSRPESVMCTRIRRRSAGSDSQYARLSATSRSTRRVSDDAETKATPAISRSCVLRRRRGPQVPATARPCSSPEPALASAPASLAPLLWLRTWASRSCVTPVAQRHPRSPLSSDQTILRSA